MASGESAKGTGKSNPLILVVALAVFALVLGFFGAQRYGMGKESSKWPSVTGKIVSSHVAPRRTNNKNEYMPSVRYDYTVSGRSLIGSRITASDTYEKTSSGAADILKKYPVGAEIPVFFNPDDPAKAVLVTGLKSNVFVLLGAAAICLLLAVLILVSELKKKLLA